MIDSQVQAFAELGALFRSLQVEGFNFVEAKTNKVADSEILEDLRLTLEEGLGRVDRVYGVTFDGNATFKGKADQKISLGKSKVFAFTISPDQVYYKPINGNEVMQYAESDKGWAAMVEFATTKGKGSKAGKKLNCKPGNYQCGGKCQSDSRGCPSQMSPEQRKAYQSALKKAKAETQNKASKNISTGKGEGETNSKHYDSSKINSENPIEREIAVASKLKTAKEINAAMAKGEISPDVALMKARELGENTRSEVENFLIKATPDEIRAIKNGQEAKKKNGNGSELQKELGSAEEFRTKPKIQSKAEFDSDFDEIYDKLSSEVYPHYDGLIPIVAIRKAMGNRLSTEQFDDFIKQKVDQGFALIGGEATSNQFYSTRNIVDGGITTALGGVRFYAKKDK